MVARSKKEKRLHFIVLLVATIWVQKAPLAGPSLPPFGFSPSFSPHRSLFKELLMQPQAHPPSPFPMLCQGSVPLGTPPPLSPFLLFPHLGTFM